jgi:hypothetical protein
MLQAVRSGVIDMSVKSAGVLPIELLGDDSQAWGIIAATAALVAPSIVWCLYPDQHR